MRRAFIALALLLPSAASAADPAGFTRKEDLIYGRKYGTALTLDVLAPAEPNGFGVIWIVSGGWWSDHSAIRPEFMGKLIERGYTVFAVVHGSQPKFTIPEAAEDVQRAVRFIRHRAAEFKVRPDKLGVTGGSAGGHLSLLLGTAGKEAPPDGKAAKDPVDRESSRVQAVACFFPPTDFLNYGKPGEIAVGRGVLKDFRAPFDFHEFDQGSKSLVRVALEERILDLGRQVSPVNHVSPDDPPALIIHGDADRLVPIQQAQVMVEKLEKAGVPAKLVTREGASHGWPDMAKDLALFADWFDEHLRGLKK